DLQKNAFYNRLSQNASLKTFHQDYIFYDSLLKVNEELKEIIGSAPVVLSLHVTSARDFQLLFLQQQKGEISYGDIEDWATANSENTRLMERIFAGQKIYDVKNTAKQSLFSFTFLDGILALSRNTILVED